MIEHQKKKKRKLVTTRKYYKETSKISQKLRKANIKEYSTQEDLIKE